MHEKKKVKEQIKLIPAPSEEIEKENKSSPADVDFSLISVVFGLSILGICIFFQPSKNNFNLQSSKNIKTINSSSDNQQIPTLGFKYKEYSNSQTIQAKKTEYLVNFVDGAPGNIIRAFFLENNVTSSRIIKGLNDNNIYLVEDDTSIFKSQHYPNWKQYIEYVEKNASYSTASSMPNDTYFESTQSLRYLILGEVTKAWEITKGDGVKIAYLDTCIFIQNDHSINSFERGINYTKISEPDYLEIGSENIYNPNACKHGNLNISIAVQQTNNKTGMAGIAPDAIAIPFAVIGEPGSDDECIPNHIENEIKKGNAHCIAKAIRKSTDLGIDIINMSFAGSVEANITISRAIEYAYSKNVTLIAAAGNDGGEQSFPANHEKVIGIGAHTLSGNKADFSNLADLYALGDVNMALVSEGISLEKKIAFKSSDKAGCLIQNSGIKFPPEIQFPYGIAQLSSKYLPSTNKYFDYIYSCNGTSQASANASAIAALVISRLKIYGSYRNEKVRNILSMSTNSSKCHAKNKTQDKNIDACEAVALSEN